MADFQGEFDDAPDEEHVGPLLPPEDRLWRHPSELGASGALSLDPAEVRVSWLEREPTHANAWTAGLVGALLATGIVVVGTHLAAALGNSQPSATSSSASSASTVTTLAAAPVSAGLGARLRTSVSRVGAAVGVIDVANQDGQESVLGLSMGSNGMVLTAAAPFIGNAGSQDSSILVTLPGNTSPLVGAVVGIDRPSGLALIHVNGASASSKIQFSSATPALGEVYLAVTAPSGTRFAPALVTAPDITPELAGTTLVDASSTDLDGHDTPLGSPIVGPSGEVVGIVTGDVNGWAIFEPTWLAVPVARELQSFGVVRQGWLGIEGASEQPKTPLAPAGVMVKNIVPRSAADRAGLRAGDFIVSLNGTPISSMPALKGRLYILKPGTTASLVVVRKGVRRDAPILLGNALGN